MKCRVLGQIKILYIKESLIRKRNRFSLHKHNCVNFFQKSKVTISELSKYISRKQTSEKSSC